jgi:hypothetical protein
MFRRTEERPNMPRKSGREELNVDVGFRPRWGKLQKRAFYALVDGHGEARSDAISRYCWDAPPTEQQLRSQWRAARSIGARPVRREGWRWVWRLNRLKPRYEVMSPPLPA